MRSRLNPFATAAMLAAAVSSCAGCSGQSGSEAVRATPAAPRPALSLVALGDSVALAGPDCNGCTSFVDLWARQLTKDLRRKVIVTNGAVAGAEAAGTLTQVKTDTATREDLKRANVIVVQVGFNDTPWNRQDDPCGAAPDYPVIHWRRITRACTTRVVAEYAKTLDAILAEVDRLRTGRPAGLRVTTLYNAVIGNHVDPSWDDPAAIAPSKAALDRFARVQCRVARAHRGTCADVNRAFNGPDGREPAGRLLATDYTHPSAAGQALIARVLARTGNPLRRP